MIFCYFLQYLSTAIYLGVTFWTEILHGHGHGHGHGEIELQVIVIFQLTVSKEGSGR